MGFQELAVENTQDICGSLSHGVGKMEKRWKDCPYKGRRGYTAARLTSPRLRIGARSGLGRGSCGKGVWVL